jgi:4-amino-4-deoxy-L-arabinose transferase-like glycosyltransferase
MTESVTASVQPFRPSPRLSLFALLAFLLVADLTLSLGLSENLNPDSADQLIFGQRLALGYHDQPPLYSWMTWCSIRLFGPTALALDVVKTLVLAAIFVGVYRCSREILGDERRAALATAATLLIPTFSWHALFYLTHTNLLCAICAFTLHAVLRLRKRDTWADYAWLGVCVGLGVLSKYNYVFFAAALVAAGLTVTSVRVRLLNRRLLLSAGIALVIAGPHLLWLVGNWNAVMASLTFKARIGQAPRSLGGLFAGTRSLVTNIIILPAPLVACLLVIFPQVLRRREVADEGETLLGRFFLAVVVLMLLQVAGGAVRFHERWLQPFTILTPIYFFTRLRDVELPAPRLFAFRAALMVVVVVLCIARTGQIITGTGTSSRPADRPFAAAASRLAESAGPGATIVTWERDVGGNLCRLLPNDHHLCAGQPLYRPFHGRPAGKCVVVWNPLFGSIPPQPLTEFVNETLGMSVPSDAPVQQVEVAEGGKWKLDFIVLDGTTR